MRNRWFVILLLLTTVLLAACAIEGSSSGDEGEGQTPADDKPVVMVYKSPTCGCCGGWVDYMEANGFTVEVENVDDPVAVKRERAIPQQLYSCHTAVVDGYTIEGHVPAAEIERLLAERPDVAGLAVAGMPIGSPGMETEGVDAQPYDVVAFDKDGNVEVYAHYEP